MLDITEIDRAIAELEDAPNHTPSMCARLANLYMIRDHKTGDDPYYTRLATYSKAAYPIEEQPAISAKVEISGNSEFLRSVTGKDTSSALAVVDELMDNLKLVNPRVYESVIRKIQAL